MNFSLLNRIHYCFSHMTCLVVKQKLSWVQRYSQFASSETKMVEGLLHLGIIIRLKAPLRYTKNWGSSWSLLVYSVQNGEVWRLSQLGMLRCSQSSAQSNPFYSKTDDTEKDWGESLSFNLSANLNDSSFISPFKSPNHIIKAVKCARICQKRWIGFLRHSILKKRKKRNPPDSLSCIQANMVNRKSLF